MTPPPAAPPLPDRTPCFSWRSCRCLLPALAALGAVALVLAGVECAVRLRLRHHMAAFAARMSPAKLSGNMLQTRAFQTPGLLPIYGSSELNRPAANRPDEFFRRRPTGFSTFLIGRGGCSCLILTQKIAAVGAAAHDKKVAVFLSPSWFLKTEVSAGTVKGNLAPLQLGSWVFRSDLSLPLRQRIARRLLDYPEALENQPLLAAALESLDQHSAASRWRLAALTPLGRAQNFLLERLDYCALLREMLDPRNRAAMQENDPSGGPGARVDLDWSRLAQQAEAIDRAQGNDSPYSVGAPAREVGQRPPRPRGNKSKSPPKQIQNDEDDGDALLAVNQPGAKKPAKPARDRDPDFYAKLAESREWIDLSLLLSTLKELGADAIFINQPFNGVYRDLGGNSALARRAYYDKLHAAIDPTGYPLLDFSEQEEDKYFFNDSGHPSGKAWIYYDHALSDFYSGIRG